jgi:hypothetical protein
MSISVSRKLLTRVVSPVAAAACAIAVVVPASTASAPSTHRAATTHSAHATNGHGYSSGVAGSFGKSGKVTGHFKPLRSYVRNGHTFVQGDLALVMRRSNGQLVGRPSRHDVAIPVNATGAHTARTSAAASDSSRATCSILHLVLGPLNLNLLGLKVHLNKVVLDITAQSGSGNLLGNLLCAVAHLLDGTSPTLTDLLKLSSLLNQIIGILT